MHTKTKSIKTTLFHLLLIIYFGAPVKAVNYYFSMNNGDDSRTALEAQSPLTPWKTLEKLNAYSNNLKAGDSILFKRGNVFTGTIKVQKSGTSLLPIVFADYGNLADKKPVISGLTTLTDWTDKGNGIWESDLPLPKATVNMVLINGSMQAMGRYPNSSAINNGYLTFESHSGTSRIIDNQLAAIPDWTGGELIMRPNRAMIDRNEIQSHTGNTITYVTNTNTTPFDNYGYFIQNHIKTLDTEGEWFYDAQSKKMSIFFGTNTPATYTVQASVTDTLVAIRAQSNIVFSNLSFLGSNEETFQFYNVQNITVRDCDIRFSGANGISVSSGSGVILEGNRISETNNVAVYCVNNCMNTVIRDNAVKNAGIYPGMGRSGNNAYEGILIWGTNNTVEYNTIDSCGYIAIHFAGDNVLIKNNTVNHFAFVKDDGGGIYTWTGASNLKINYGRKVIGNIVLNGVGAGAGTEYPSDLPAQGIYMDDNAGYVDIIGNTVANNAGRGVFLHNAHNINLTNNTVFNNKNLQLGLDHDSICPNCLVRNNTVVKNIFFSKGITQLALHAATIKNDLADFGAFDSNYYCRPFDDNYVIRNIYRSSGIKVNELHNLKSWQTKYSKDSASVKSPVSFSPYSIDSLIGSNKFPNGNFNKNINGLYSYSPVGNASTAWSNGVLDGGALQFSFNSVSGLLNTSKVIIGAGPVSSAQNYILRFSLLGTKSDRAMNVFLRQSLSPFAILTPISYCNISEVRSENEFVFSKPITESDASIIFEIDEPDSTLWMDNIQLYEAGTRINNPDSYIRLEYNPSKMVKNIILDDVYRDVNNTLFTGTVKLPPFSSIILMKDPTALVITGANAELFNDDAVRMYPNPSGNVIQLFLRHPEGQKIKTELFDVSGRLITTDEISITGNHFQYDISKYSPGIYLLQMSTSKKIYQRKFVKND